MTGTLQGFWRTQAHSNTNKHKTTTPATVKGTTEGSEGLVRAKHAPTEKGKRAAPSSTHSNPKGAPMNSYKYVPLLPRERRACQQMISKQFSRSSLRGSKPLKKSKVTEVICISISIASIFYYNFSLAILNYYFLLVSHSPHTTCVSFKWFLLGHLHQLRQHPSILAEMLV